MVSRILRYVKKNSDGVYKRELRTAEQGRKKSGKISLHRDKKIT
jgi:hypothetical protein